MPETQNQQVPKPPQNLSPVANQAKKITIIKLITIISSSVILILIVAVLLYWLIVLRPLTESQPQSVTSPLNQTTESSTNSNEVKETVTKQSTEDWLTFEGKFIDIKFKYPRNWVVTESDGVEIVPEGKVNKTISLDDKINNRSISVTENFLGGFEDITKTKDVATKIDGIETKRTYYEVAVSKDRENFQINVKIGELNYLIVASRDGNDEEGKSIIDQILDTVDFF